MGLLPDHAGWPMLLSTLAGLSTSIGGIAAVIFKPSHSSMAWMLGCAIGVMATVSIVELIVTNALENDAFLVIGSAMGGALAYYVAEPLFPKVDEEQLAGKFKMSEEPTKIAASAVKRGDKAPGAIHHRGQGIRKSVSRHGDSPLLQDDDEPRPVWLDHHHHIDHDTTEVAASNDVALVIDNGSPAASSAGEAVSVGEEIAASVALKEKSASLMRLGMLMAITMTLHNLPEGFAVAFSAMTDFGPIMAVAIAVHNIPEGIIIAAPIYAATGSRWKALALATASGLSEPLGAFSALVALKPFFTEDRLHYMLAFVGGLMLAVCVIELWPEAKSCKNDRGLAWGILVGSLVMAWTLYVGT